MSSIMPYNKSSAPVILVCILTLTAFCTFRLALDFVRTSTESVEKQSQDLNRGLQVNNMKQNRGFQEKIMKQKIGLQENKTKQAWDGRPICPLYWQQRALHECCMNHKSVPLPDDSFIPSGSNSSGSDCLPLHYENGLPLTALASSPGSGNTWTRHIIQQLTGIYTWSEYLDEDLVGKGGFPLQTDYGPASSFKVNRVIVMKTHATPKAAYQRAVVILRNPYDTILANFNSRCTGSHTLTADREDFNGSAWSHWVRPAVQNWYLFYSSWLQQPCVYILIYERLRHDYVAQVKQLARVLGVATDLSEAHLSCLKKNSQGQFKRDKPEWMQPAMKLYSSHQINTINSYIRMLGDDLEKYKLSTGLHKEVLLWIV